LSPTTPIFVGLRLPLLTAAIARDEAEVRRMLRAEQEAEQAADRANWQPRKQQLEVLRLSRRND